MPVIIVQGLPAQMLLLYQTCPGPPSDILSSSWTASAASLAMARLSQTHHLATVFSKSIWERKSIFCLSIHALINAMTCYESMTRTYAAVSN